MNALTRSICLPALLLASISLAHADTPTNAVKPDQADHHGQHAPYAGMLSRETKSLSEQQIADLRAGKGMSLALPAELNGYPGPAHTLELAEALKLSPEQREKTESLFAAMHAEAKSAGEMLIATERGLDQLFQRKQVDHASLVSAVERAAMAQARLRVTHLRYHLAMVEVLTPEQITQYQRLRGY